MKLQHAYVLFAVVLGLAGCAGAPAEAPAPATPPGAAATQPSPLDGRSYDVTLEMPEGPPVKDTLRFDAGKFESTACTALGFPEWSGYAARQDGGGVAFHAVAKHPSGTTMDWNGSIKGDAVDGTANRTMNGKTDLIRFKGSLHM